MRIKRGTFLNAAGASAFGGLLTLTGCARIGTALTENEAFRRLLETPEKADLALLGAAQPLAREYRAADISPDFRHNGFDPPSDPEFARWARNGWQGYQLRVGGLVDAPQVFDLRALRSRFPAVTQITRHDCVEGWSVIGGWTGARLGDVLQLCRPQTSARYVVFYCLDDDGQGNRYFESLDLRQAAHPQALLAYALNGKPVPLKNGAPLRLKVPTQLGYKSAKHVARIELVASLGGALGRGGYWENQGYEWFAGI